ncbi:hypothetical protein ACJX0J_024903, partial [Zea mays]
TCTNTIDKLKEVKWEVITNKTQYGHKPYIFLFFLIRHLMYFHKDMRRHRFYWGFRIEKPNQGPIEEVYLLEYWLLLTYTKIHFGARKVLTTILNFPRFLLAQEQLRFSLEKYGIFMFLNGYKHHLYRWFSIFPSIF